MSSYFLCQDEKKQRGNGVALDPPHLRRPLPRHPHPPHPHRVPRTHQAAVGPALAVMVSLTLKSGMLLKVREKY